MTVKIFVARDDKGNEWAPDTVHEVASLEWALKKAWVDFNHLPMLYCIIANVRYPSADLVVLTERGLGILEMKHKPGEITIGRDNLWYADGEQIDSGIHINPRRQVQKYAEEIRRRVLQFLLPANLKRKPEQSNEIKFQTGVWFTNPTAKIDKVKKFVDQQRPGPILPWESNFSVIDSNEFTTWIRELRFQANTGPNNKFQPVRISSQNLMYIVTKVFGAIEWKEMIAAMPTGQPYAYLLLEDDDGRQVFNLHKDESFIGRSPDCDVVIPERYGKVSKLHCKINRTISGVTLEDLSSVNGTFCNQHIISGTGKASSLAHNDLITLGGQIPSAKVCKLRFELYGKSSLIPPSTEVEK